MLCLTFFFFFFFFNDTATTEIYTLSLHDALPICYRRNGTFETAVTDGFRFDVAALDRSRGGVVARLGAGQTYAWPTWEVPTWHERLKPAYEAMRDVWGSW